MNEAHHLLYIPTFTSFLLQLVAPTELESNLTSSLSLSLSLPFLFCITTHHIYQSCKSSVFILKPCICCYHFRLFSLLLLLHLSILIHSSATLFVLFLLVYYFVQYIHCLVKNFFQSNSEYFNCAISPDK